jgi:hypothetical protein
VLPAVLATLTRAAASMLGKTALGGVEGITDRRREIGMTTIEARITADDEITAGDGQGDLHPIEIAALVMPMWCGDDHPAVDEPAKDPAQAADSALDARDQAG